MKHIQGTSREQTILFPESINDYIEEDNEVRFIEAFVENISLREMNFKHSSTKSTGRPPYNPSDLLKLYIYGYLNKIRSSRRLEKETKRNVEVIWLMKKLTPDFKTIADFRKDNTKALKEVTKQFVFVLKKLDLFGNELVAIDGSKFRAQNGKKRNFSSKKLKRTVKEIDSKIDQYLNELDENDKQEQSTKKISKEELEEKIASLKKRKTDYQDLVDKMEESKVNEISLTDPDAKSMLNSQRVEVCYNVQTSVDNKHKLIVDYEVTNCPADQGLLYSMATRSKEILGVDTLEVLADKGYYDAKDIKKCVDENLALLIPRPKRVRSKTDEWYSKEKFIYDKKSDTYKCPSGSTLTLMRLSNFKGKKMQVYSTKKCANCNIRDKCTDSYFGRTITRWEHEEILERMEERVKANKEKVRMRQWLSEHPFGTIKRSFDQGYMLLKGLEKTNAEFSLTVLAYNIKRAINIVGIDALIAAI